MGISAALGSSALLPAGLGFRNKIINGDFRVWQRGTPVTASVAYTADRWVQVSGNSIVHTQSTDTPNSNFAYSLSMAGTGTNIAQRIESLNCGGISGTVTVSFWYKSTAGADNLIVGLYTCNTENSFNSLTQVGSWVTVSSSPPSSWTYYSYTFSGVSSNSRNGLALYISRGVSATSTTLITGVQVEANNQATPFEQRPIGIESDLCKRYFWRCVDPAGVGVNNLASQCTRTLIPFHTEMRAAPTSVVSGTLNFWNGNVVGTATGLIGTFNTRNHGQLDFNGGAGAHTGISTMYTTGGSQYIDFTSEL